MDNLENFDVPVATPDAEAMPIDPAAVEDEAEKVAQKIAKINQ